MQKKVIYGIILATMVSGAALAGGPDRMAPAPVTAFKPFLGVNYSYLNVNWSTASYAVGCASYAIASLAPSAFNGVGFLAGLKYGQYLGFVTGWNHYFQETRTTLQPLPSTVTASSTVQVPLRLRPENFYFDVRGYYPFYAGFDLIGSVGANISDFDVRSTVNMRMGVGADYFFTPNWGVEVMYNYIFQHNVLPLWNNAWTVNVGINYMFD